MIGSFSVHVEPIKKSSWCPLDLIVIHGKSDGSPWIWFLIYLHMHHWILDSFVLLFVSLDDELWSLIWFLFLLFSVHC